MMAKFAYFSVICLLWMSLTSFRGAEGQTNIPSPNNNPCDLYHRDTGEIISTKVLEVEIQETDMLSVKNKQQVINVNIAGGDYITLTGNGAQDVATLNQYGIDLFYNRTSGFIQMSISEEIDRDGPSADNRDDLEEIVFELCCSYQTPGVTTHGNIEKYIDVNLKVVDSNDIAPVFSQSVYYVSNEELRIQAEDGRGSTATASVLVVIERNPLDTRPQWLQTDSDGAYRAQVLFDVNNDTLVSQRVRAFDPDRQGNLRYRFTGDQVAQEYFAIDPVTGDVSLIKSLELDTFNSLFYRLFVTAFDTARPSNSIETVLYITVVRNPNNPTFQAGELELVVLENQPIGFTIQQITASNSDGDTILYTIEDGSESTGTNRFFSLNQNNGSLVVVDDLRQSRAIGSRFTFRVVANDQGYPPKYAFVLVTVIVDRDQADPVFQRTVINATVTDTYQMDQLVTPVLASDNDERELRVRAYDSAVPYEASAATVLINVVRNQNEPIFLEEPYQISLPENTTTGTLVYRITAEDADGDIIRYSMLDVITNNIARDHFYLHPDNGNIWLVKSLTDFSQTPIGISVRASDQRLPERIDDSVVVVNIIRDQKPPVFTNDPYAVTITDNQAINQTFSAVTAFDQGPQLRVRAYHSAVPYEASAATVLINVVRNQNEPIFLEEPYQISLPENTTTGTLVYRITAEDADGDIIRYSMLDVITNNIARDHFYLHPDNGNIWLVKSLTDFSQTQIGISVRASDQRLPERIDDSVVVVNIIRDQKPPVFTNDPYAVTITDNQAINQTFSAVMAFDQGPQLRVRAYDSAVPYEASAATVLINVVRNQNEPIFLEEPYQISLPENTTTGTLVYRITAEDADGDIIRYSMLDVITNNIARDHFYLHPDNGNIWLVKSLTDFSQTQIGISVRASDQRLPERIDDSVVVVNIIRDQKPPVFTNDPYAVTITDNLAINQTFSAVMAFDQGPQLRVRSYDSAVPYEASAATVLINVVRNQNEPIFLEEPYQISLPENTTTGTLVYRITAEDADGDIIRYSMLDVITNNIARDHFYLHPDNGNIWLVKSLTDFSQTQIGISVRASDQRLPGRIDDSVVVVNIIRDQKPPVFTNDPYAVTITDNQAINQTFSAVTAFDQDPQGSTGDERESAKTVTKLSPREMTMVVDGQEKHQLWGAVGGKGENQNYKRLTEQEPDQHARLFQLSNAPGRFVFEEILDFGQKDLVPDDCMILDAWDNIYIWVGNSARDDEKKEAERLAKKYIQTDPADRDPDTPIYRVKQGYEPSTFTDFFGVWDSQLFQLRVGAYERAVPYETSKDTFFINEVSNQNEPIFREEPYQISLPENLSIGTSVYRITAEDADGDIIRYSMLDVITNDIAVEHFYLHPENGNIVLVKSLTDFSQTQIGISVRASDQRLPERIDDSVVVVNIIRDQKPPVFTNDPYAVTITDNQAINQTFSAVTAFDQDPQTNKTDTHT